MSDPHSFIIGFWVGTSLWWACWFINRALDRKIAEARKIRDSLREQGESKPAGQQAERGEGE